MDIEGGNATSGVSHQKVGRSCRICNTENVQNFSNLDESSDWDYRDHKISFEVGKSLERHFIERFKRIRDPNLKLSQAGRAEVDRIKS
jgi:hypothetical protein